MRPSSRSRGTSWRKLTSWSPVQTSSRGGARARARPPGAADRARAARPGRRSGRSTRFRSAQVVVLGDALVHPVRLDQAQERLPRQVELADGRLQLLHHRPGRARPVAGLDLPLELVEQRRAGRLRPRRRGCPRAGRSRRPPADAGAARAGRGTRRPGSSRSALERLPGQGPSVLRTFAEPAAPRQTG